MIEVHLFDIEEDIYGELLRVEFVSRTRDERRFASKKELMRQLSQDRVRSREILGGR